MEKSQLALVTTGAFMHPYDNQTNIESRWSELIASPDLCHRACMCVDKATVVKYGDLVNPLAVILWNLAGVGVQTIPTAEERAEIEARVLRVYLCGPADPPAAQAACQILPPPRVCSGHSPCLVLRPEPGARVIVAPPQPGVAVPIRVLVIPSSPSPSA